MLATQVWKSVTADRSDFLNRLLTLFNNEGISYCVIDGQGVNAFVEPLISLDLDLVVSVEHFDRAEGLLAREFETRRFPHSLNVSAAGSDLRIQIQTDPRYLSFPDRAEVRDVLGLRLPVADIRDLLQGKVWAAQDASRRPSKRRKDLLDIERLIEAHPELRVDVPAEILTKLES